ncbi:MAG: acyl-CoA dehydrogenase family protein [Chloroflexota bacterium]
MATQAELLQAVEQLRPVVEANWMQMETERTLPDELVAALDASGLLMMSAPRVVGGSELDLIEQLDVYQAVGYLDASLCWAMMTCGTGISWSAGYLSEAARNEIYGGSHIPRTAIAVLPAGRATPIDGGYRLTGSWNFCSGVRHAEWLVGGGILEGPNPRRLFAMFPAEKATIVDNWHAAGLRGSGSAGFKTENIFVPNRFVWFFDDPLTLPTKLHRLGLLGFVINEHPGLSLGVARRALDTVKNEAKEAHSRFRGKSLAGRPVFQKALAEAEIRWLAARSLIENGLRRLWAVVDGDETAVPSNALLAELRAIGTFISKEAIDITTIAFQYGGGRAIMENNVLQRCLRDIHAVSQHYLTSDVAFENYGQFILELHNAYLRG